MLRIPDAPLDPPADRYITCDKCRGEIYEYETAYLVHSRDALVCEDCLAGIFDTLSLAEKAALIDAEKTVVILGR